MAQKSNSHYAPQLCTNQSVFKSLLNCTSVISLSRNATGREFQRRGPAMEKLRSNIGVRFFGRPFVRCPSVH